MHMNNLVHGDIRPGTLLCCTPPKALPHMFALIGFGCTSDKGASALSAVLKHFPHLNNFQSSAECPSRVPRQHISGKAPPLHHCLTPFALHSYSIHTHSLHMHRCARQHGAEAQSSLGKCQQLFPNPHAPCHAHLNCSPSLARFPPFPGSMACLQKPHV